MTPPEGGDDMAVARAPDDAVVHPLASLHERAPAGVVTVAVPGGWTAVDPTSPDRTVTVVDDPSGPIVEESLDHAAARLALLRWLDRWSPDPLPRRLLDVEIAVAQHALDPEGDPDAEPSPWRRLERETATLLGWLRLLQESAPPVDGLAPLARAAAEAWLDLAPPSNRSYADMVRGLADLPHAPVERPPRGASRRAPFDRAEPAGAVRATGPPTAVATVEQVDDVDWELVPNGVLDAADGTVRWRLTPDPDSPSRARLEVSVLAVPGAPATSLVARFFHPGSAVPQTVPLLLAAEGHAYVGDGSVDGLPAAWPRSDLGAADGWRVDIVSGSCTTPTRFGVASVEAAARRWAHRALARTRLAVGADPWDEADLWREARRGWRVAADLYRDAELLHADDGIASQIASRRRAACLAFRAAALGRVTTGHDLDEAVADARRVARDAGLDVDDVRPRWARPGWAATVAERCLTVPEDLLAPWVRA